MRRKSPPGQLSGPSLPGMSVSLQEQISTLFSCLAMGLGVGLLYDLLRLVRLTPAPPDPPGNFGPPVLAGGLRDALFSAGSSSATAGCGCTWPCACCWGQRLIFFCSAPDPAGAGHPGPGRRPVSGLGDSASGGLFVFSRLRWQKILRKWKKLGKSSFFFPGCGVQYII